MQPLRSDLGRQLTLQFRGSGDKLGSLTVNGKPAARNRLSWSELGNGTEIVAVMAAH